jgi:tRNA pseudouridine38-40 synthase
VSETKTTTYKIVIAYDGTNFKGWQRGNGRTVQATLEEALSQALADDPETGVVPPDISVDGAGRTDAGVHAEGQVASLVLPGSVKPGFLWEALNEVLPSDLAVLSVDAVDDRFHARYRATAKTYRYRVIDGPSGDPFLRRFSWRLRETMDVDRMRAAAEVFTGRHDFAAFTADKGKKDKTRTIRSLLVERNKTPCGSSLDIVFHGDGFLWKQVRIITAGLILCGTGETDAATLNAILRSGDRSRAPGPAPARGLTLVSVEYQGG